MHGFGELSFRASYFNTPSVFVPWHQTDLDRCVTVEDYGYYGTTKGRRTFKLQRYKIAKNSKEEGL